MKINSNILIKVSGILCLLIGGLIVLTAIGFAANTLFSTQQINALNNFDSSQSPIDHASLMKASNAIQNFTGNSNLKVSFKQWSNGTDANYQVMANGQDSYYFNPSTDTVEATLYYNNTLNSTDVNLNESQALDIATKYAQKHYDGFSDYDGFSATDNIRLTESKLIDHQAGGKEYDFTWNEIVNGTYTFNSVKVSINPTDGSIIRYIGKKYQPLTVSIMPKVSKDLALTIASSQFPNLTVTNSSTQLCVISQNGTNQKLVWNVVIPGGIAANNTTGIIEVINATETIPTVGGWVYGGIVTVDAITGKVIDVSSEV